MTVFWSHLRSARMPSRLCGVLGTLPVASLDHLCVLSKTVVVVGLTVTPANGLIDSWGFWATIRKLDAPADIRSAGKKITPKPFIALHVCDAAAYLTNLRNLRSVRSHCAAERNNTNQYSESDSFGCHDVPPSLWVSRTAELRNLKSNNRSRALFDLHQIAVRRTHTPFPHMHGSAPLTDCCRSMTVAL